ncbi:hypothetical protein FHS14_004879 [Paenibacillus baekrokdamisoli]|nr:hypothetical protein [Paenibacillus baekrokdamisoli]
MLNMIINMMFSMAKYIQDSKYIQGSKYIQVSKS